MTIAVSVVVTFHNAERYVEPVAAALRDLDGEALEIIVVDDHSTDGTPSKLEDWVDRSEHARKFSSDSRGLPPRELSPSLMRRDHTCNASKEMTPGTAMSSRKG